MSARVTYPDTFNRFADTRKITLDKILQALNNGAGGGGGGGGSGNTFSGFGPPSAGLGSDGNTYWDKSNKDLYVKDSSTWTLVVDLI